MPPATITGQELRDQILMKVALQFGRHCKAELTPAAREKLLDAIDTSLVAVFDNTAANGPHWDHETQDFILACVAEAAERCDLEAKKTASHQVTLEAMHKMVDALLPSWRQRCPIDQPAALEGMGPPCNLVGAMFGSG